MIQLLCLIVVFTTIVFGRGLLIYDLLITFFNAVSILKFVFMRALESLAFNVGRMEGYLGAVTNRGILRTSEQSSWIYLTVWIEGEISLSMVWEGVICCRLLGHLTQLFKFNRLKYAFYINLMSSKTIFSRIRKQFFSEKVMRYTTPLKTVTMIFQFFRMDILLHQQDSCHHTYQDQIMWVILKFYQLKGKRSKILQI